MMKYKYSSRFIYIVILFFIGLITNSQIIKKEYKLHMTSVPKINNPFNIPNRKINKYILEIENNGTGQIHYSEDIAFVDNNSDYNFVRLMGKYPIDIRYKNSPLTKEDAKKLPEKMDDDVKRAIVANSVKLEKIE